MARFSRGFDAAETPVADSHTFPSPSASSDRAPRANKYGGRCRQCDGWVPEGEGLLVGSRTEGWGVEHADCTAVETVSRTAAAPVTVGQQARPLVPGWYTVVFDDDDDHRTIQIEQQDDDDDFMPGRLILSYLSGSDNERDYTRFGHVDERGNVRIWKKHQGIPALARAINVLIGDPQAAAQSYAMESEHCYRCNRRLTSPESLRAGIGPDCMAKFGY